MIETPKIESNIKDFFEAFVKLTGEEKLYFIAQIDKVLAKKSDKDRNVFLALIKAAKDGKSYDEAISAMKKA